MSSDAEECLSAEDIAAYVDGTVSSDRKADIDRHLDECRLCEAAVSGAARLESSRDYVTSVNSVLTRVRARTATASSLLRAARRPAFRVWPNRQYLALAATLVFGVAAAIYLARPGASEALFQRYFEPYPSTHPIVRAGAPTDGRTRAMALYEAHDYRGALAGFQDSLTRQPHQPTVLFYAGLCRLALGQNAEAIRDLEQVRHAQANGLEAPAEWYLALACLRAQNVTEARSRLKRIVDARGFYEDTARALLTELDRRRR